MEKTISFEFENEKDNFKMVLTELCAINTTMLLPEILVDLSEDDLKKYYPNDRRPTIAKKCAERTISFSLHYSKINSENVTDDYIPNIVHIQDKSLSRVVPGYEKYNMISKSINNNDVACLLYRSYSIEHDLFNILFVFIHKEKLVQGNFACLLDEHDIWTMFFQSCIESLEFKDDEIA